MNDYKYYCDRCNFCCDLKSRWNKHTNTELHITGKKKIRSDCKEINICKLCIFQTKNKFLELYLM